MHDDAGGGTWQIGGGNKTVCNIEADFNIAVKCSTPAFGLFLVKTRNPQEFGVLLAALSPIHRRQYLWFRLE